MKRIAIIGCGGSGKTALATQLGAKLGLPVHHLDRLFWRAGWQETPKEEWAAVQRDLCAQPAWIMDGNYGGTMALWLGAADMIIFLDYPTATCLWGAVCRWHRYRGRTRPEMIDGCPERLSADYLRWIWSYRRTRRPGILRQLARQERKHPPHTPGSASLRHRADNQHLSSRAGEGSQTSGPSEFQRFLAGSE